ncbi:MAG: exodeoxyribonuclease VII small subunit [Clostridiales bacterium]|jgi:exodeoxyribonuclease VII small subunit|nr:exodeoxyribonuclease VII small subunit [Clostridiales bacterium]
MKNFEENMRRLDAIIAEIEGGTGLEAAFALYKEGAALAAECAADLVAIEGELIVLSAGEKNELSE